MKTLSFELNISLHPIGKYHAPPYKFSAELIYYFQDGHR